MTWKCHVTTLFFQSVSNSSDVRDKCVRGDLKANVEGTDGALTIVKSSLVYSPTQVNVAVMKAASAYLSNAMPNESDGSKSSTMKTRSLDTEIVYFLSPSKSISDSLRQYGVGEGDSALCAICVVLVNGDDPPGIAASAMAHKHKLAREAIAGKEIQENTSTNSEVIAKGFGSKVLCGDFKKLSDFCTSKIAVKDLL